MCRLEDARRFTYPYLVLLFKRILNYKKSSLDPNDKRKAIRYAVGAGFPFKAVLTLRAHDEEGELVHDKLLEQSWAGRLTNLSETGASIQLHPAAVASRGEPCLFKLSLDDYELEIGATIAHFRVYQKHTACGFAFDFPDFETQKAYLQILEPVSIGGSLAQIDPAKVRQETPGLAKAQFVGISGSILSVWRRESSPAIYSFDFRMNAYGVRWSEGMTEVEAYGLSKLNLAGEKTDLPFVHLSQSELEEVRWLFCLAVPNLSKAVPSDVRKFLTTLVA